MEKELNSQNVEIKDLKEKVEGLMGKFESVDQSNLIWLSDRYMIG